MSRCKRSVLILPLLLLQLLSLTASAGQQQQQQQQQRKPLSDYTEADLERLDKQWEENDPDTEPEAPRVWKSPQMDLTKTPDLTDPTLILRHSSRGQPILLSVQVSGSLGRDQLETLSHRWQLELFNAHMETTRRVHEDGRVLLVAMDGAQVVGIRQYLLAQPLCHSVTIEGHTVLGRGATDKGPSPDGKTEL